ncbi:thiol reductant ABC exporter subunit CydC [Labedella phragmitis]|uniref:Thiol reductant ABC exporter subunit CydC n=1 Tax=Labedella phragmitis TaxID=2498849 RepID=A0A444PVP6_9MICO|nr:thiol reductant ABC exporter subunit CydC [Labedella phragmitis]RWZ51861.1 thiol reductant ABC exporter subunit CydC [Labedella phragmitis]
MSRLRNLDEERAEVLRLARPGAAASAPGVLTGLAAAASTVALLACSAWLIVRASESPPVMFLGMAVVGVRAFALGRAFFRYLERLLSHDAAFRSLERVRVHVFERLVPLAPDGLGRTSRGSALATMVSDIDDLQDHPLRVVQPLATSLGVAVLAVGFVATISPLAALTLLVSLVAFVVITAVASTVVAARAERSIAPLRASLVSAVVEHMRALDVLIAYGTADRSLARVRAADDVLTRAVVRRAAGTAIGTAALSLFGGLAVALALLVSIPAASSGGIGGPAFGVIVLVPLAVFEIVATVPQALGVSRQVAAAADRVAATAPAERPSHVPEESGLDRVPIASDAPALELVGVTARWGAQSPVLSRVDLSLREGERVWIDGESGSGKTSLAHVLVRFLDHCGEYRLRGVDVRTLHPDAVRRVVGLVEQRPFLFDESIRQNLLFARDDADDALLLDVLDRVGLRDWVASRGGLDARVGERGALVSGGQAGRIALARALLRDFPIVVLDEPTASVESDLADRLLRDLLDASSGRTVVLISHADVPADLDVPRATMSAGVLDRVSPLPRAP